MTRIECAVQLSVGKKSWNALTFDSKDHCQLGVWDSAHGQDCAGDEKTIFKEGQGKLMATIFKLIIVRL